MKTQILILACACALSACGPDVSELDDSMTLAESDEAGLAEGAADDGEDTASTALPEQCDAEDFRALIGTPVSEADLPEAGPMFRAYGENDIITQEYLPQRTNVVYDMGGIIQRVDCG